MPEGNRKENLVLRESPAATWYLRTIGEADGELLRRWKNRHRASFFHREIISPEQQARWLAGFLTRPHDFLFLLVDGGEPVGCLGIREVEGGWDVYNVIRGVEKEGGVSMARALRLLLRFALRRGEREVSCLVLKDNPALAWYERCHFRIAEEREDCFRLVFDRATLVTRELVVDRSSKF